MLYKIITTMPPSYVWAVILLVIALIAHHAVRGKKRWSTLTGIVLSFLLGWLTETLGLGWYAATLFGSWWMALGLYVIAGFIWLNIEILRDIRLGMVPRFRDFAENWCRREGEAEWSSMSLAVRETLFRTRLQIALDERNRKYPHDPILFPRFYNLSRERRWWFASWFLFWPAYLLHTLLDVVVIDPWKWLSQLLAAYVGLIQKLVIPSDIPHVNAPHPGLDDDRVDSRF